eukprot:CFRG5576T1
MASTFPVSTVQKAFLFNEIKTEIVINSFKDKFVIIATQLGRPGTLVEVTTERSPGDARLLTYNVKTLLGKRDVPLYFAMAQNVLRLISDEESEKSLLLYLGLKDESSNMLKTISNVIVESLAV